MSALTNVKVAGIWLGLVLASTALVGTGLFVANEIKSTRSTQTPAVPSPAEAEALLTEAHHLAQAPSRQDLCQTTAQNAEMCRQVLKWAKEAHALPSAEMPSVLEVSVAEYTANTQGARILHIRGTLADGSSYAGKFSAVRTNAGEIRSQNAVYWYSDIDTVPGLR